MRLIWYVFVDAQRWREVWNLVQAEHPDRAERKHDVDPVYDVQEFMYAGRQLLPIWRATLQNELRILDVQCARS